VLELLSHLSGGLSANEQNEIRAARITAQQSLEIDTWSSGTTAKDSLGWYYTDGTTAKDSLGWYYPDGTTAKDSLGWYYPDGTTAKDSLGWHYPNGDDAKTEGNLLMRGIKDLPPATQDAVGKCLSTVQGDARTLALIALAWQSDGKKKPAKKASAKKASRKRGTRASLFPSKRANLRS
jgi:hypothetical protein